MNLTLSQEDYDAHEEFVLRSLRRRRIRTGHQLAKVSSVLRMGHRLFDRGLCADELYKFTSINPDDLEPGTVRKIKLTLELA